MNEETPAYDEFVASEDTKSPTYKNRTDLRDKLKCILHDANTMLDDRNMPAIDVYNITSTRLRKLQPMLRWGKIRL